MEEESAPASHEPEYHESESNELSPSPESSLSPNSRLERLPRLLRIIETLQSGQVYNSAELAKLCNVSRRTVFRDISALQHAGMDVVLDQTRQGYYLPHRLMFPPSELNVAEALSLVLVCQELGGTDNGIPFQSPARTAAAKICRNLPPHIQQYLGEVTEAVSIGLESHHPLSGAQAVYEIVLRALIDRRQLRIDYDAASPEGRTHTVLDVYRVIFRRRSWYVVGRSSLHKEVRIFHLGRIIEAILLDDQYEIPQRFTLERFLGNAWHLIREVTGPRRVVIHFEKKVARNVAEVRWHRTQETTLLPDGRLEFRVTVDGLEEISWWILGYGDQAEVMEPPELRDRIRSHAENLLRRYSPAN